MIPATWEQHRRADGELIGYLAPIDGSDDVRPMTLMGTPAGDPADWYEAGLVLDEMGLSYLADRWLLAEADGEREVVLVEIDPERVVVANADVAQVIGAIDIGDRIELEVPTTRLRRP